MQVSVAIRKSGLKRENREKITTQPMSELGQRWLAESVRGEESTLDKYDIALSLTIRDT